MMKKQKNELSKSESTDLINTDNKESRKDTDELNLIINTSSKNAEIDETVVNLKQEDLETSRKLGLEDDKKIDFENEEDLNKSENFVILPKYKSYKIPGKKDKSG